LPGVRLMISAVEATAPSKAVSSSIVAPSEKIAGLEQTLLQQSSCTTAWLNN
jgi:hypothetical protein